MLHATSALVASQSPAHAKKEITLQGSLAARSPAAIRVPSTCKDHFERPKQSFRPRLLPRLTYQYAKFHSSLRLSENLCSCLYQEKAKGPSLCKSPNQGATPLVAVEIQHVPNGAIGNGR